MSIFYRPALGVAADFIPYNQDGRFYLFYLQDWRDPAHFGEGTPWYLLSTADFIHYTEHGEMLARGGPDDQDRWVFTGSVIAAGGEYHIFYTGHNSHFAGTGRPVQAILHAVSPDLLHWRKQPEERFFAPVETYEPDDWRDPFVFWNAGAGEYWMLLAARLHPGPFRCFAPTCPSGHPKRVRVGRRAAALTSARRRGCTALATSPDLQHWTVRQPFYAPGLYYTHECPDLFRMGDWWYLLFSEFSERTVTRYRLSRSLEGPWLTPANDTFDGRAFYAAKTASSGDRRYLFGWNPTREGETDRGAWQWGGSLVVHELVQNPDGTLGVRLPESVAAAFAPAQAVDLRPALGECRPIPGGLALQAEGSFAAAVAPDPLPSACRLDLEIEVSPGTKGCGLILRADPDLETGYYLRLEPQAGRLVFDSWPRPGDLPYLPELERPLAVLPGRPVQLTVLIEGSVCEVYAGGQVALSTRLYDHPAGLWGVFAQEGAAQLRKVSISRGV